MEVESAQILPRTTPVSFFFSFGKQVTDLVLTASYFVESATL
jgi:hypothetical protein